MLQILESLPLPLRAVKDAAEETLDVTVPPRRVDVEGSIRPG